MNPIKPQAPRQLWCPSVNSFKFLPCDHTPPVTWILGFLARSRRRPRDGTRPGPGRHRLQLGIRRCLISFSPPAFVLDQRKRPWQALSPSAVLRRSQNLTSPAPVLMPPTAPIDHYSTARKPTNGRKSSAVIPYWTVQGPTACLEHSNFFMVTARARHECAAHVHQTLTEACR